MTPTAGVLGLSPNVSQVLSKYGSALGGGSLGSSLLPAQTKSYLPAQSPNLGSILGTSWLPPRTQPPGVSPVSKFPNVSYAPKSTYVPGAMATPAETPTTPSPTTAPTTPTDWSSLPWPYNVFGPPSGWTGTSG